MPLLCSTYSKSCFFPFCFIFLTCSAAAQKREDSGAKDSTKPLDEVIIKAYEQNRKLREVPAAVNYIGSEALDRFNTGSLVAAINSTPGIRMEERSPGSYRINIRGSSLRSPFGVRNVKVYFNDLPLTDPGGQTYLNSVGFYNIASIEILKGPGSSLYGAGTGGVMLMESGNGRAGNGVSLNYTAGSYGTQNIAAAIHAGTAAGASQLSYQHRESSGYRDHASVRHNIWSWTGRYVIDGNKVIKPTIFYSSLFYQTPGALTRAEYSNNPRTARPGSAQSGAGISQQNFVAGLSYQQTFTPRFSNTTALYGAFNGLKNPNLRGYDKADEPQAGGRTLFTYKKLLSAATWIMNAGAEAQGETATNASFKNNAGVIDSLRYSDNIRLGRYFLFLQAAVEVSNWTISAGASINKTSLRFERFNPAPSGEQHRSFNNEIAPRLALSKKMAGFTLYSSVSKGFSPPTTAELLPTGGAVNLALNAEHGINYDVGFRGRFFNRLSIDLNAFSFSLRNTIVQRRDAFGGDYYTNSGRTRQHGMETSISYEPFTGTLSKSSLWISHTWHDFHYREFKQLAADFSGNRLPGTPPHTVAAGADLRFGEAADLYLTYFFSGRSPLNDANTAYADAYHLMGAKAGYLFKMRSINLKLFAGIDNLLNVTYSLGNDINGFGGRFYNAAPGRNYYAGLSFNLAFKPKNSS